MPVDWVPETLAELMPIDWMRTKLTPAQLMPAQLMPAELMPAELKPAEIKPASIKPALGVALQRPRSPQCQTRTPRPVRPARASAGSSAGAFYRRT